MVQLPSHRCETYLWANRRCLSLSLSLPLARFFSPSRLTSSQTSEPCATEWGWKSLPTNAHKPFNARCVPRFGFICLPSPSSITEMAEVSRLATSSRSGRYLWTCLELSKNYWLLPFCLSTSLVTTFNEWLICRNQLPFMRHGSMTSTTHLWYWNCGTSWFLGTWTSFQGTKGIYKKRRERHESMSSL